MYTTLSSKSVMVGHWMIMIAQCFINANQPTTLLPLLPGTKGLITTLIPCVCFYGIFVAR